jgi:hypothetical protein
MFPSPSSFYRIGHQREGRGNCSQGTRGGCTSHRDCLSIFLLYSFPASTRCNAQLTDTSDTRCRLVSRRRWPHTLSVSAPTRKFPLSPPLSFYRLALLLVRRSLGLAEEASQTPSHTSFAIPPLMYLFSPLCLTTLLSIALENRCDDDTPKLSCWY